jgi:uncharacterized protein YcfJ
MKKLVLAVLSAGALVSAQAQLFGPEAWNGAALGSFIGGLAGSDCHHGFSGEGAAIGAAAGLLAGALVGEARRQDYEQNEAPYDYSYSSGPTEPPPDPPPYAYYSPNAYCAPAWYYVPPRLDYALPGAASGALIGQAADHTLGEGTAIVGASSLVSGGAEEAATQHQDQKIAAAQTVWTAAPAAPAPYTQAHTAPQPHFQIPDAPRVADAPTF